MDDDTPKETEAEGTATFNEQYFARRKGEAEEIIARDKTIVAPFWINKYKKEAARNWDQFYKRNENRFFKDRHWIGREFPELQENEQTEAGAQRRVLVEVGCGVGNLLFPTLQETRQLFIYSCDFSKRAIDIIKASNQYNPERCLAFVADITKDELISNMSEPSDFVTMIFVLSAIAPEAMPAAIANVARCMKPGALLFFRDYGLYDQAQLRFQPGHRLSSTEPCYVRQDGTLSFYFSTELVQQLFLDAGLQVISNQYVLRQTVNHKLNVSFDRIFVQATFTKPTTSISSTDHHGESSHFHSTISANSSND